MPTYSEQSTKPARHDAAQPDAVIRTNPVMANPVSIGILFLTAVAGVFALYVGKEIALPVLMAIIFKLLLKPIMDFLQFKLRFPAHWLHYSL